MDTHLLAAAGPPSPSPPPPSPQAALDRLPAEIIDAILDLVEPADLARLCQVCRRLHTHASSERVWQARVQANVPGCAVTSPFPYSSFRSLFAAHELHWFLPRFKLWIAGKNMVGRLVLVRYDQRRGCIEGYQLLAVNRDSTEKAWPYDPDATMCAFDPDVHLHLDRPVLQIDAPAEAPDDHTHPIADRLRPFPMHTHHHLTHDFLFAPRTPQPPPPPQPAPGTTPALSFPPRELDTFPYYSWWPTPYIPSAHRVPAVGIPPENHVLADEEADNMLHSGAPMPLQYPRGNFGSPTRRADITDRAFHIRINTGRQTTINFMPLTAWRDAAITTGLLSILGIEEIETFATLDPHLYTPTPDKPYRGIWVGDYGRIHGCEFLLLHQPDDDDNHHHHHRPPLPRYDGESGAAYAARARAARVHRGRLEAIKLTGDPNVPRGERSFVVPDLGDAGFVTELQGPDFAGVRVVKSYGHIAHHGFQENQYIDAHLLLLSPDRLAMHWFGLQHVSFFQRVYLDSFLAV